MVTEAPIVATGIEHKCAVDSEVCIKAKGAGEVTARLRHEHHREV